MSETIHIVSMPLGSGARLVLEVEEGRNFRRLNFKRQRNLIGEWEDVGKVWIYMGTTEEVSGYMKKAEQVMSRIHEVGFDKAAEEFGDGSE